MHFIKLLTSFVFFSANSLLIYWNSSYFSSCGICKTTFFFFCLRWISSRLIFICLCFPILGIPSSDSRNANLYFLDVVQQANTIFHLFDKQFNDHLMPLIRLVTSSFIDSQWILFFLKFKNNTWYENNKQDRWCEIKSPFSFLHSCFLFLLCY
jgi:hypothetical protein